MDKIHQFTILVLSLLCTIVQAYGQDWVQIDEISIVYQTGANKLTSPGQVDQYCEQQNIYKSVAANTEILFQYTSTQGYMRINYVFDAHFNGASGIFTVKQGTNQLLQETIPGGSISRICLIGGTPTEQFINYNIQSIPTTFANSLPISFKFEANPFYIKNLKIFIKLCCPNCLTCNPIQGVCVTCEPNYNLISDRCICGGVMSGSSCVLACPVGQFMNKNRYCQSYSSLTTILVDQFGQNYQFSPDYNTTLRTKQIQINGVNVAGSFIQNEYISYSITNPIVSSADLTIQLTFYFLGNIDLFSQIQIVVNGFVVSNIEKYGDYFTFSPSQLIGISTCTVSGYTSCKQMQFISTISSINSIDSFQIKGRLNLTDSKQAWAFGDLKLQIINWNPTTCGGQMYQGQCISTCPNNSIMVGLNCIDLGASYKFPEYLIKLFDGYDQFFFNSDSFPLIQSSIKLIPFYYDHRYILGGYNNWQTQQVMINILCKPHYKARLFVKVILIDYSSSDSFTIYFDSKSQIYSVPSGYIQPVTCPQTGQYLKQDYCFIEASTYFEINHNDQQLEVAFQCNASLTSFCAIYDFYVIIALCPINCLRCSDSNTCIESSSYLQVFYNCPDGYYYSYTQCLNCIIGCKTCSDSESCTICYDDYQKYGTECYCKTTNLKKTCSNDCSGLCTQCLNNNDLGSYDYTYLLGQIKNIELCESCDWSQGKVMNLGKCNCQNGYYMNKDYECSACYNTCKTCINQARFCTSCYSTQFRQYESQSCNCFQGYFEADESYQCMKCADKCQRCLYTESNCTQCYTSQHRVLSNYDCICQIGYFEVANQLICQKCNDLCEYCQSVDICTSCNDFQFRIQKNNQCQCQSGYYDNNTLICQKCYYTCQECNQSNLFNQCIKCPNTRQRSNNQLNNFECKCLDGYYDIGQQECIDCSIYINPPITHYCYSFCGDLIIQWNEQCDDGNNNQRDGCDQCQLNNQNCQQNICLKCYLSNCKQCIDGYYLENNTYCQQCSQNCITCNNQYDCIKCKYYTIDNQCINCNINYGYTIINTQCINICGDGIKTIEEQCDDGNIQIGDGCNQICQIEEGYQCNDICVKINYIQILLQEDQLDKQYDNYRNIKLTFDQQVNITGQQLNQSIIIEAYQNNYAFETLSIVDKTQYKLDYNIIDLLITIKLKQTVQQPQIKITINDDITIVNVNGTTLKQKYQTITVLDYYQLSDTAISNTKNLTKFNSYILYLLFGFALLAFIFGGLDIFWNLLDTLQVLSYLKYLNVIFPYNLESYFEIFGFAEFDFIKTNVNLENTISQYIDTPNPAFKFEQEGYSSVFYVNILAVFVVLLTTIGTYILFHVLFYLIFKFAKNISTQSIYDNQQEEPNVFIFLCVKLTRNLQNYFYNLKIQYKTGLLRAFLTVSYDLNLAIFLQLKSFQSNGVFLLSSGLIAILFLLSEGVLIYLGIVIMSNKRYYFDLQNTQLTYGALYEGLALDKNPFSYYYNVLLFAKKLFFMFIIVFIYDYPCLQITFVSLINFLFFCYLICNNPLEQKVEFYKQAITEALIWFAELLILMIGFGQQSDMISYQGYFNIGWVVIATLTLLILIQLIIDVRQHMLYLIENYQIIRTLINKFRVFQMSLFTKQIEIDHDESLSLVGSQGNMKNNSSGNLHHNSTKKIRKLVTFSIT